MRNKISELPEDYTFRAWVPACATGEEAYSVAITLVESMKQCKKYLEVQVFATDLDDEAVQRARSGVYPDGIAADVPQHFLDHYFVREDSQYRVKKEIRDTLVFAQQNIIKDPPFGNMDLVCCRNLLIYLTTDLQKRLLPILHYALRPEGILMLGSSESILEHEDHFERIDRKWKIFRKAQTPFPDRDLIESTKRPEIEYPGYTPEFHERARPTRDMLDIEQKLLSTFAPTSVIANRDGTIKYVHGRTGLYFEMSSGQPRNNLFEMAREGLHPSLSSAIRQAEEQEAPVVRKDVKVKTNAEWSYVDITVRKVHEPDTMRGFFIISFEPVEEEEGEVEEGEEESQEEQEYRSVEVRRLVRETAQAAMIFLSMEDVTGNE